MNHEKDIEELKSTNALQWALILLIFSSLNTGWLQLFLRVACGYQLLIYSRYQIRLKLWGWRKDGNVKT
ncbi:MAG: hypothetical protein ACTSW1_07265 [Candidatus Hodarchaeales archaeon]